ncbi:MAG: efflux RND transporter periplasmic adaptor subunit [Bacteroidaceae bacterium]|nr:efflux RND transporter periplasmic adaptor subunit [Bacteroidaceae bacterium]
MKKKGMTWVALLIVVVGVAGYVYQNRGEGEKEEPAMAGGRRGGGGPLNVTYEVLSRQSLTDEIQVTGLLIPDEEVSLSFETSGKIVEICFKEGARVSRGQLLAKVNDAQLQANLKKLQAQIPLAEGRVYRQNALLERDAVSKEALEQVKTELETLKAEIDMVKAQIELTELRAPFDGVIGLRQVSLGAYATPSTVVSRLTRLTPLKVEFAVPERYSSEVKAGSQLQFTIDGYLKPFSAKVYACESAVNTETHTLSVRALYANADGALMPGRYTSITLTKQTIDATLAVPSEAIVPEMGKDKVFVCRGGKAQPVEIKTGLRTESRVEVKEGLSEGDTLITSGILQLRTGLPVVLVRE